MNAKLYRALRAFITLPQTKRKALPLLATVVIAMTPASEAAFFTAVEPHLDGAFSFTETDFWPRKGFSQQYWDVIPDGNRFYVWGVSGAAVYDTETGAQIGYLRGRDLNLISTVRNNIAYVAGGIYDLTDLSAPKLLAPGPSPDAEKIVVKGNHLFFGQGKALHAWNISDLRNPVDLGAVLELSDGDSSWLMVMPCVGDTLYICFPGGSSGMLVDVSTPSSPKILSTVSATNPARYAVAGKNLLLGSEFGIDIYDIANPAQPQWQASIPGEPVFVGAIGTFLYTRFQGVNGTQIWNIADPTAPVRVRIVTGLNMDYRFVAEANKIFTLNSIWNAADPSNPVRLKTISPRQHSFPFVNRPLPKWAVSGDYAIVGEVNVGWSIIDTTDPANLVRVATMNPAGAKWGIAVDANIAYVTAYPFSQSASKLTVFDISDPRSPRRLTGFSPAGSPSELLVKDGVLYVACGPDENQIGGGLHIYDVAQPATPRGLRSIEFDGWPSRIRMHGTQVYVETGSAVQIVDVSDPAAPVLLPPSQDDSLRGIQTRGNLEYKLDAEKGLVISNVSNPDAPVVLSTTPVSGAGSASPIVTGPYVIVPGYKVLSSEPRSSIFDVSDPTAPKLVDTLAVEGTLYGAEWQGDRLLVLSDAGLQLFAVKPLRQVSDEFSDGNADGWLGWSPFAAFGAPASFSVIEGTHKISSPKSPAPQILPAYVGTEQVNVNYTDVEAQVDINGWFHGENDSPGIALQARTQIHPNRVGSWYTALLAPRPLPAAEGSQYSPKASFAITKVIRSVSTTLAIQTFPDDAFSPDKTYTVWFQVRGTRLEACLFEKQGATRRLLSELVAVDSSLDSGYSGVNSLDRAALVGAGNNPVQISIDNYSSAGIEQAPILRIAKNGVVYWSVGAQGFVLKSANAVDGLYAPSNLPITLGTDGFINTVTPSPDVPVQFFRLEKP